MKTIKYVLASALILGILGIIFKRSNNDPKEKTTEILYQDYYNKVEKNILTLSPERRQQREKWLKEIAETETYKELVKYKKVSVEYLPVLTAINDAIQNTLSISGEIEFRISENFAKEVENLINGEDKMRFVIIASSLSMNINGGLTKELVEIFEEYKNQYGIYCEKGKIYYFEGGKTENLKTAFNLSHAISLLNPNNEKALDAIYETNFNNISSWSDNENSEVQYQYPFMTQKTAYIEHLKLNYKKSKYLPNMNDYDAWDKYDPIVKNRIELFIFNKDCEGLQNEFNIAEEILERLHSTGKTGKRNSDLIIFLQDKMNELGCFN